MSNCIYPPRGQGQDDPWLRASRRAHLRPLQVAASLLLTVLIAAKVAAQSWTPVPLLIGDNTKQGSLSVISSPAGWTVSTNASAWAAPGVESLYYAAAPVGPSGTFSWQPPNAGSIPANGVTGIMMRRTVGPEAGAPFVFVGVRQGTPGVELAWRSLPGQPVQVAAGILSATDFPDGSKLKLEWVQGRAFLSYQQGGVANAPWRRRLAIELGGGSSPVYGGLAFGSTSVTGATVNYAVVADQVQYEEKLAGARWMRVVEPFEDLGANSAQGDRFSMQSYEFSSGADSYSAAGITMSQISGTAGATGIEGDFWRLGLSGETTSALESFEFNGIHSYRDDVVDVYVRLGEVNAQTALPLVTLRRTGVSPHATSSLAAAPLGNGVWEFVGQIPASTTTSASSPISLTFDWALEAGLKDRFAFDGILLAGQSFRADQNGDDLPDGFGGDYASVLRYTGDFDGDGWLNGEEFLVGSDPLVGGYGTVELTKQSPLDSPWDLARGRWSALPAEVKATYVNPRPGRPAVVEGFPLVFNHSGTGTGIIGFGRPVDPAPLMDGGYVALTDAQGVARSHFLLAADCPLLDEGMTNDVVANALSPLLATGWVTYPVRPYDNAAPGPVDLLPVQSLLTHVSTVADLPTSFLVVGDWLLAGESEVPGEGAGTSPTGRVALRRWDGVQRAWQPAGYLPLPSGFPTNGRFGQRLVHDGGFVAVSGGGKVYFYDLSADGQSWLPWGAPLTTTGRLQAIKNGWLAMTDVSGRGDVSLYKKGSGSWSFVTKLQPVGTGHSDKFGEALAFSEEGTRLVVGAPSDPRWYISPSSLPYVGEVWTEWEVQDPIWDWVYDEYGNPTWAIVGYTTRMEGAWVPGTVYPQPPAPSSVYVYELTGASTWSLADRIMNPDPASLPSGLQPGESTIWQPGEITPTVFGASVASVDDWVIVGAPQYAGSLDDSTQVYGYAGSAIGYQKNSGTGVWDLVQRYNRSNTRFGLELLTHGRSLYMAAGPWTDSSSQQHEGFVDVLSVQPGEIVHVDDVLTPSSSFLLPVVADEQSLWLSHSHPGSPTVHDEYNWLPVVDWDDPEESTIAAWLTTFDANFLTGVPATETVAVSFMEPSARWDLTAPLSGETAPSVRPGESSPLAVRIKDGAGLAGIAPAVDWLGVTASDKAGQTYQEYHGIRVRGQVPAVPEITVAGPTGRQTLELVWDTPLHRPEVIVVEKASGSSVENWQTALGTPAELDALFTEAARLGASYTRYIHAWVGTFQNTAFRLRAANSEGTSAAGPYLIVDLDSDNDGLPDWWEELFGNLAPGVDTDNDGLSNLAEYQKGTDPLKNDTDGDGRLDGSDTAPLEFNIGLLNFVVHTVLQ